MTDNNVLESRARRAAQRCGLDAEKSRWRRDNIETAQEVIDFARSLSEHKETVDESGSHGFGEEDFRFGHAEEFGWARSSLS